MFKGHTHRCLHTKYWDNHLAIRKELYNAPMWLGTQALWEGKTSTEKLPLLAHIPSLLLQKHFLTNVTISNDKFQKNHAKLYVSSSINIFNAFF